MKVDEKTFLEFAAGVLGTPPESLSLETTYGSVPEWDSMAHLRLVTETAAKFGVEIPFADVVTVTSLWELLRRINGGAVKKVVAVDLDNTLWDGVVGEDGVAGIRPNADLQRELKALRERGVLLAALSKNNPEDLAWLFDESSPSAKPGMVLGGGDFAAWRVNWESKAENLVDVARELNLGIDSFVFVDDNPAERLEMGHKLPDVTVAAFPPNLAAYFSMRELTDEDRRRTDEYRAEAQRRRFFDRGLLADQLFAELGVVLDVHEMRDGEVVRVAQLSQKANQFNVCANRYTEAEVRELGRRGLVVTAHAKDRFGDQGLIAYVVAVGSEILDWVMSCRAMGRGIEERVEREVERLLKARGVGEVAALWRATGRNAPVQDLFERFGFRVVAASPSEKRYVKTI